MDQQQQQHGETPLETPLETMVETPTDEQPRAEMLAAERANRMAKHTQMRALIAWLVEHQFAHKQVVFCDAIGLAPVELSRYKTGKTSKGKEMTLSELDVRITSDGDLCQGVQRRHLRPVARAVGRRATAAAEREGAPLKQARPPHVAAPSGSGKRKKPFK